MGELIKIIREISISRNIKFDIELNEGDSIGEEIIHIQNDRFRFAINKSEFIQVLALILSAKDNLLSYKGEM